jgi:two-component system, NtrC family, response regulator AtoC
VTGEIPQEQVLLVEADDSLRRALTDVFDGNGYGVTAVADPHAALELLRCEAMDVVVADLDIPGVDGGGLLGQMRAGFPEIPFIALTAAGSVEHAVELTRAGLAAYLTKPLRTQALLDALGRVLDQTRARRVQVRQRRRMGDHLDGLVGASRPMLRLFERIRRVAVSTAPVLVVGETGTGKELVAQAIQRASGRNPFVPVNCGAIPDHLMESELFGHRKGAFTGADRDKRGLFQAAHGGTLFLDEIGELPLALQPKLLRVIESGEVRPVGAVVPEHVDVRIVAATHRDLEGAVEAGEFREDLYWRINVLHLEVPPLRERPTDIPLLVEHFCSKLQPPGNGLEPVAGEFCVTPTALAALVEFPWPGNVRQLRSVIERSLTFAEAGEVDLDDLPGDIRRAAQSTSRVRSAADRQLTLAELEREYIYEVLRRTGGNKSKASEWLGVPRRTLYRRLEEFGESAASQADM